MLKNTFLKIGHAILIVTLFIFYGCATQTPKAVVGPKAYITAESAINFPKPFVTTFYTANPEEKCIRALNPINNKFGEPVGETKSRVEIPANTPIFILSIFSRIGTIGCRAPYAFVAESDVNYYMITEQDRETCTSVLTKNSPEVTEANIVKSLPVEVKAVSGKICPTSNSQ